MSPAPTPVSNVSIHIDSAPDWFPAPSFHSASAAAFASDSSTTAQFHYKRKQMILERLDVTVGLTGEYVEICEFTDRPIEVRGQRHFLPYRVFDKESAREYRCCRRKQEAGSRSGSCERGSKISSRLACPMICT